MRTWLFERNEKPEIEKSRITPVWGGAFKPAVERCCLIAIVWMGNWIPCANNSLEFFMKSNFDLYFFQDFGILWALVQQFSMNSSFSNGLFHTTPWCKRACSFKISGFFSSFVVFDCLSRVMGHTSSGFPLNVQTQSW